MSSDTFRLAESARDRRSIKGNARQKGKKKDIELLLLSKRLYLSHIPRNLGPRDLRDIEKERGDLTRVTWLAHISSPRRREAEKRKKRRRADFEERERERERAERGQVRVHACVAAVSGAS